MIQVNIQGLSGDKFTIDIGAYDTDLKKVTVLLLKQKIIIQKGLDIIPEHLRLIFSGKQLDDERCLADYGVSHKSLIMTVMRVAGGYKLI